jgi:hypothetical protein
MGRPPRSFDDASTRPRVVVITTHWGENPDEETAATRLLAGALALRADVDIVHLVAPPCEVTTTNESVFSVHSAPIYGARRLHGELLRVALSPHGGAERVPEPAASILSRCEGEAPDVPSIVNALDPDAIVLAGMHQPHDVDAIVEGSRKDRRRIVLLPYCADAAQFDTPSARRIFELVDAVGTAHTGEERAIRKIYPEIRKDQLVPLDLAFPVNRSGTTQGLFGTRFFGSYVLLLREFPPGGPRYERVVTFEVLRSVLGKVSVADIDGETWRISDRGNTLRFPVNVTRVNLWRLIAHAIATVDVRPPGPIGREAIESMLLGTPYLAPEPSAAMSLVEAANGGLWYRDAGELFDAMHVLMNTPLRSRLGAQAFAYANARHGRMDDFGERTATLVLGSVLQHATKR